MISNETVTGRQNRTITFPTSVMTSPAPREGEGDPTPPAKVEFTPEQQEKITEFIKEAQSKAAKDLRKQLKDMEDKFASVQKELEDAKKNTKTGSAADRAAAGEDVAALQAQLAEMKSAADKIKSDLDAKAAKVAELEGTVKSKDKELLTARKQHEMQRAAGDKFIDQEAVLALTEKFVKWDADRGTFVVLGDSGAERRNSAMELMTLSEFYEEYAKQKPHMVRGKIQSGTGSTESNGTSNGAVPLEKLFGKGADAKLANELARKDIAEYRRKRAEAKAKGII